MEALQSPFKLLHQSPGGRPQNATGFGSLQGRAVPGPHVTRGASAALRVPRKSGSGPTVARHRDLPTREYFGKVQPQLREKLRGTPCPAEKSVAEAVLRGEISLLRLAYGFCPTKRALDIWMNWSEIIGAGFGLRGEFSGLFRLAIVTEIGYTYAVPVSSRAANEDAKKKSCGVDGERCTADLGDMNLVLCAPCYVKKYFLPLCSS